MVVQRCGRERQPEDDAGAVSVSDEAVKLDLDNDLVAGENVNVKLKNWPPADSNLNGSFQGEVVAKVNNKEVASSTGMVDFDGGGRWQGDN